MSAHRPTYHSAKARENQGGYKRWTASIALSSKDMPSDMNLKERKFGQNSKEEIEERDLKAELLEKEKKHFEKITDKNEKPIIPDDSDAELNSDDEEEEKEKKIKKTNDSDVSDDSDDSDDDDDDEELLKELERIKKERELEKLQKEKEEIEQQEKKEMEEVLNLNPLMNNNSTTTTVGGGIKRKWNDDVIFKNQAKDEPKAQKRFINDTIRSDFHKKFMYKFIK